MAVTIPTTAAQDTILATLAAEAGFPDATAYVTQILRDFIANEFNRRDGRLINMAQTGQTLTAAQQTRIKTVLNLP